MVTLSDFRLHDFGAAADPALTRNPFRFEQNRGLRRLVAGGVTTISAKSGSAIAQTGLTVSNSTLTSVPVSPSSMSLISEQKQQLAATANFSSSTRLVTAVATGTATVTARYGGQAGNSTMTVQ